MSRVTRLSAAFVYLVLLLQVESANILGLMGCSSPSHHVWNSVLVNELASRGHNLTIISNDISKNPPPNVHYIHLEKTYDTMYKQEGLINFTQNVELYTIQKFKFLYDFDLITCTGIINSDGFKTLLNYPNDFKFDLVLNDFTLGSCLIGFVHKFGYPPQIGISAFKLSSFVTDVVGGHSYPAYIPLYYLPYDTDMTLFERAYNTLVYIIDHLYKVFYFMPSLNKMASHHFGDNLPSIEELEKLTTLVLINSHPAVDYPDPTPPNVIQVGGLHIQKPKPLPTDIENYLSKSKKGSILIALGTNINSNVFTSDKQKIILDVVRKLPDYNFLWKFETDPSEGKLTNLLVKKWLPQNDILSHNTIKLFVTHGGGLSTLEATWHAVPMVGFPFIVDQLRNLHKSVQAGVAEKLDFLSMTSDELYNKIKLVLENPSYRENMKIRSARLRDTPMKPLDTGIWWIEYILRDPNPTHLRSPVLKLGFWKSNLYDIILYTIILIFVLILILYKLCAICYKVSFRQNVLSSKKKRN